MLTVEREKKLKEFLSSVNIDAPLENIDIALTHSSFCHENNISYEFCNERLEFLGDSLLKLAVSNYLYNRFPDYNEGQLSQIRSCVVSDATLDKLARGLNLPEYLVLGVAEERNNGRWRSSTIACAFEAFLGALYVEGKIDEAIKFIEEVFADEITSVDIDDAKANYKALLQEYFQSGSINLPEYVLAKQEGPPHRRTFYIDLYFEGEFLSSGIGLSKKAAQKEAARLACEKLGLIKQKGENNE